MQYLEATRCLLIPQSNTRDSLSSMMHVTIKIFLPLPFAQSLTHSLSPSHTHDKLLTRTIDGSAGIECNMLQIFLQLIFKARVQCSIIPYQLTRICTSCQVNGKVALSRPLEWLIRHLSFIFVSQTSPQECKHLKMTKLAPRVASEKWILSSRKEKHVQVSLMEEAFIIVTSFRLSFMKKWRRLVCSLLCQHNSTSSVRLNDAALQRERERKREKQSSGSSNYTLIAMKGRRVKKISFLSSDKQHWR